MILTNISLLRVTPIQTKACRRQRDGDPKVKEAAKYRINTSYSWIIFVVGRQPVQNKMTTNHQSNANNHVEKTKFSSFTFVISCKRNTKKYEKSVDTVAWKTRNKLIMQPTLF